MNYIEISGTPSLFLCLFTFILNINFLSSKKNASLGSINPEFTDSSNHLQYQVLTSKSEGKSCCNALIVWVYFYLSARISHFLFS